MTLPLKVLKEKGLFYEDGFNWQLSEWVPNFKGLEFMFDQLNSGRGKEYKVRERPDGLKAIFVEMPLLGSSVHRTGYRYDKTAGIGVAAEVRNGGW